MIRKACRYFEEILGSALLAAITLIGIAQVVGRYLLARPFAWTEELGTLLFAWIVFIGASLALKKQDHFALDIFVERLRGNVRKAMETLNLLVVIVFCGLLIYYGLRLSIDSWQVTSPAMEIPRTWFYACVPFGGCLMLLRSLQLIHQIWTKREDESEHQREPGEEPKP